MKQTCLTFLIAIFSFSAIGQEYIDFNEGAKAAQEDTRMIKKGESIVDVYYGVGSFVGFLFNGIASSSLDDYNATSYGFGLRYENMISDDFSIGVEASYVYDNFRWTDTYSGSTYNYYLKRDVLRIMPRLTAYLHNEEGLAIFFNAAIGWRDTNWKEGSSQPGYEESSLPNYFPIAARIGAGMRVALADNIGLHLEAGFSGGRILNGGFYVKF